MNRRRLIGLIGVAVVVWPDALRAQQSAKWRRLGFVHSGIQAAKLTETGGTFWIRTFYEDLRRLGYAKGSNLVIKRFSAEGSTARFTAEVTE